MPEILFQYFGAPLPGASASANIRRLDESDCAVFTRHLELCGQRPLGEEDWREVCSEGTVYFLLFENGEPVARACREVISDGQWEIADVRVANAYRNRGLALKVCRHVLAYILCEGKTPTIRTREDNLPMRKVIEKLGFSPMKDGA